MRAFVICFVMACASGGNSMGTTPSLGADDAVLEAVYLHEIAAASVKPDEAVCLRVRAADGTRDASAALVTAIQRRHPTAVPASACTGGGPDPVTLVAGGAAVMFDIGPVKRVGGIRVEGGGGHRGGGSIVEVEYLVKPAGGGFRVASEQVLRQN